MNSMKAWPVLALVVLSSLAMAASAQAKAELSGTTINIWSGSPAVQHEDNCTTLLADVPTLVKACTSTFASTCISVDASLNITRGGATNWTNFSVNGCELRMNRSAADSASNFNITNWGNLTVISSNITTNNSARHSDIVIQANSNFSMTSSFVSEMGWAATANQMGLELNSPTFTFNNNTLTKNYNGIILSGGASGSVLTNNTASSNYYGIYILASSNNTLTNINTSSNTQYGIYLSGSNSNTLANITASSTFYGILSDSSNNNTLTNITASSNIFYGIYLSTSSNNTFTNLNIWDCSSVGSYACIYSYTSQNNTFRQGVVNLTRKWMIDMQNSNNTLFQDIQFINDTNIPGGINITSTNANRKSLGNTFLNCSFTGVTEATSSNSQLIRQWYVDVYANTSKGSSLGSANLSFRNSTGSLINYTLTNSSGWITRLSLTAYVNESGTTYNYSQYVVNATRAGFSEATKNLTFSGNALNGAFYITLTETGIVVTPVTAEGTHFAVDRPDLLFNATDGYHTTLNCSLYISGSAYGYNSSTVNATQTNITANRSLADDAYTWYVNCTDVEGNYGLSGSRTMVINMTHNIQLVIQISGTSGRVYIPGTGDSASLSLSNATYSSLARSYIASYMNSVLKALVFVERDFVSLSTARSGADMHSIGLDMKLDGAHALLAFTRGDWNSVENRIREIESGKFFSYASPTFGFGLGNIYAIKLLLDYTDIQIAGNLMLQSGRQGLTFAYNGTTADNKQRILVSQVS